MYVLKDLASLEPLVKGIAERRIVMLGEASHGTHEYYTWRTAIVIHYFFSLLTSVNFKANYGQVKVHK